MPFDIVAYSYAAAVAGGGILGYVKSYGGTIDHDLQKTDKSEEKIIIDFFTARYKLTLFSKASIPSLGAGLLFGSILGYGAYQTSADPTNVAVLLGASTTLGGIMGYRFYNSGKIMPAGIITLLSAAMIVRTITRYFTATPMKTQ